MSKTNDPNPNSIKVKELWTQWHEPTQTIDQNISLDTLSIKEESARQTKLVIWKSIIDFYHQETNGRMYRKRWDELHDPKLAEIGLEKRLESSIKGKDSANVKYKDNNWFGAMYTYAIAWGCLIPYHPDDMEDSDPKKKEIASLEAAIWSNIAATAVTGSIDKEKKLTKEQVLTVIEIGIKAVGCCLGMKEFASVGIIKKACDRGIKLHAKLPPTADRSQYVSEEQVGEWKKQVELLQGCDEKSLFKDVEVKKRVI